MVLTMTLVKNSKLRKKTTAFEKLTEKKECNVINEGIDMSIVINH
jgi:hypothetical protein